MEHKRIKTAVLTIGQAPRCDVTPQITKWLDPMMDVKQRGALDGMSVEEIAEKFEPVPGEFVLTSRLVTGQSVRLSAARMELALQQMIDECEDEGCEAIVLLCTGVFPRLHAKRALFIEPDRVLTPAIARLAGNAQLGLIIPLAEQKEDLYAKWRTYGVKVLIEAATPYTGSLEDIGAAAERLAASGAQLIVLDCMGYSTAHRRAARESSGKPVILSNEMLFKMLSELGEY
ncbi:AroM family protein [Paenibacillus guangzhouensis]|uniref:AroM family protein n=1 Tax=Paenibacillus guangzhouensis TaxID=1473112 RepID=UPI001267699A|nr:AroM family protein [Paenibacillus guangzhouensis]